MNDLLIFGIGVFVGFVAAAIVFFGLLANLADRA